MRITRAVRGRGAISLVAMVDVLMILLVFFMVTSTYLDLDMVPLAGTGDSVASAPAPVLEGEAPARLLVRLDGDGGAHVLGRALDRGALRGVIAARLAEAPATEVIVLPSGQANVQALAGLMDVAVAAGATRLRIVRLEAAQ